MKTLHTHNVTCWPEFAHTVLEKKEKELNEESFELGEFVIV